MGGLRIIAGEARGRALKTFKGDWPVRPILGRIKKSLFDILQTRISGAVFLDLYSGTGAVGIEALSRGAGKVVFVDGDASCVSLVKENLRMLGWEGRAEVLNADITKPLHLPAGMFDIVFLGPPYKDEQKRPLSLSSVTLTNVVEARLLKDKGIIISQHHVKEQVEAPAAIVFKRREKYGDTYLDFYA